MQVTQQVEGWVVTFHLVTDAVAGGMVIERMELAPAGDLPAGGLTTSVVRRVGVAAVRQYAAGLKRTPPTTKPSAGRGRPPSLSPAFYRRVARRHMELLRSGRANIPKVLADEFGYKRSSMRSVIRRARQMGYFNQILSVDPVKIALRGARPRRSRRTPKRH